MPKLSMEVPHALQKQEAATRLRAELEKRRGDLEEHVSNLEANWSGEELAYSFSTFGMKVGGTLLVQEGSVQVNADLPLAAMMVKGRIEQAIQDEFGKLLS